MISGEERLRTPEQDPPHRRVWQSGVHPPPPSASDRGRAGGTRFAARDPCGPKEENPVDPSRALPEQQRPYRHTRGRFRSVLQGAFPPRVSGPDTGSRTPESPLPIPAVRRDAACEVTCAPFPNIPCRRRRAASRPPIASRGDTGACPLTPAGDQGPTELPSIHGMCPHGWRAPDPAELCESLSWHPNNLIGSRYGVIRCPEW